MLNLAIKKAPREARKIKDASGELKDSLKALSIFASAGSAMQNYVG